MRDKNGQVAVGVILAIVAVVGLGMFAFVGYNQGWFIQEQTTLDGKLTDIGSCADSTGVLTINAVSALDGASDPSSPTITCGVGNDKVKTSVTSGTTTFPVGEELTCLVSKADYIDTSFTKKMPCGGLVEQVEMFYSTSDNPSIRIKNDDGDFMTDSVTGGATNQTDLSTGETVVLEVEFQGTNTEASGDGIYVIELPASTTANVTDIVMAGADKVSVPSVHTLQNAGSKAVAFQVPAVEGAEKKTYALSIVLASGKDLVGGVYTDWYAGQDFVDDDGYIESGIEDSDGTAKYENTADYDFYVN